MSLLNTNMMFKQAEHAARTNSSVQIHPFTPFLSYCLFIFIILALYFHFNGGNSRMSSRQVLKGSPRLHNDACSLIFAV